MLCGELNAQGGARVLPGIEWREDGMRLHNCRTRAQPASSALHAARALSVAGSLGETLVRSTPNAEKWASLRLPNSANWLTFLPPFEFWRILRVKFVTDRICPNARRFR
jgi:hypothetical protein